MREPRASYICYFEAKSSALSNYRGLILDENSIKSGGWLGPTPNAYPNAYYVLNFLIVSCLAKTFLACVVNLLKAVKVIFKANFWQ